MLVLHGMQSWTVPCHSPCTTSLACQKLHVPDIIALHGQHAVQCLPPAEADLSISVAVQLKAIFQAAETPASGSRRTHLFDQLSKQLEQSLTLTPETSKIILVTGPHDSGNPLYLCCHITGLLT